MLEKYFQLKENGTTVRTEFVGGLTTYITMAYILIVNPIILSKTGMDFQALITATALSAMVATLFMGIVAKLPFACAPGMGLNAFFAYTVVLGMGYSWQMALTAVFIEGLIFILLTALNIREAIIKSIPLNIKFAITVGIGLFITLIGFSNAGIVVTGMSHIGNDMLDGTLVKLGSLNEAGPVIAMVGLLITAFLLAKKIKGALLLGIVITTIIGIPFGITKLSGDFSLVSLPPSMGPIFAQFDFSMIFTSDLLVVLFVFLFVDLFDTVGTLIGVSEKAGLLDKEGNVPRVKKALFADAIGTTVGALFGTSTVTTYIESATGISAGGKTGLTAVFTALLFGLSLFLTPLFTLVPAVATAPVLILVGLMMIFPIVKIQFDDYTESLPAFLTIVMMPFAYSIAEGIVFGVIAYVVLKISTLRFKELTPGMYVLAALLMLKFFIH